MVYVSVIYNCMWIIVIFSVQLVCVYLFLVCLTKCEILVQYVTSLSSVSVVGSECVRLALCLVYLGSRVFSVTWASMGPSDDSRGQAALVPCVGATACSAQTCLWISGLGHHLDDASANGAEQLRLTLSGRVRRADNANVVRH